MTIIYSAEADNDIDGIYGYFAIVKGSPSAAENIIDKITTAVGNLEVFPNWHKKWGDSGFRFFLVSGYYVFYCCDESSGKIIIERVIHSQRDVDGML